eukprot:gene3040-3320_t
MLAEPLGVLQIRKTEGVYNLGSPNFSKEDYALGKDKQAAAAAAAAAKRSSGPQPPTQPPPALMMTSRPVGQSAATSSSHPKQYQGTPRADTANNYFAGRDFCVLPLDASYTFKIAA